MNGTVWRQESQRITADITKHSWVFILLQHFVQGGINISVAASLTKCRRTRHNIFTWFMVLKRSQSQGFLQCIGVQFARTGQFARQTTTDDSIARHHSTYYSFNKRLALFSNEHLFASLCHLANQVFGQRILADFQHWIRTSFREAFLQIIVCNTACDDTQFVISGIFIAIICTVLCAFLQHGLLPCYDYVAFAGVGRQEHPTGSLSIIIHLVLRAGSFLHFHYGTRVSHACCYTHQHRQMNLLREVVSHFHHVVSLLLAAGFKGRNHGKLSVKT